MTYYHVSTDPCLPPYLSPRVPSAYYTSEPRVRRICVSPSILGCLRARYKNNRYKDTELYLYRVYNTKPAKVPKLRYVTDSYITQEHWLLARARVKLIGKIIRYYSYLSAGHTKIELKDTQYMGGYTIHYLNGKVEEYEEKIGKVRSLRKIIKK